MSQQQGKNACSLSQTWAKSPVLRLNSCCVGYYPQDLNLEPLSLEAVAYSAVLKRELVGCLANRRSHRSCFKCPTPPLRTLSHSSVHLISLCSIRSHYSELLYPLGPCYAIATPLSDVACFSGTPKFRGQCQSWRNTPGFSAVGPTHPWTELAPMTPALTLANCRVGKLSYLQPLGRSRTQRLSEPPGQLRSPREIPATPCSFSLSLTC